MKINPKYAKFLGNVKQLSKPYLKHLIFEKKNDFDKRVGFKAVQNIISIIRYNF